MDITLLQGAITSLKAASDIAQGLVSLKVGAEVNAKAIELQSIVMSAQSGAIAAQSEQFTMLEQIRSLKEEVANAKAWKEESQRYALIQPWDGAFTYALKEDSKRAEPPHWICAKCYQESKKSILQDNGNPYLDKAALICPSCKTTLLWTKGRQPFSYV